MAQPLSYGSGIDQVAAADRANAQLALQRASSAFNMMQSGAAALDRQRARDTQEEQFRTNVGLQSRRIANEEARVDELKRYNEDVRIADLKRKELADKRNNAYKIFAQTQDSAEKGMLTGDAIREQAKLIAGDADLVDFHQGLIGLAAGADDAQDQTYDVASGLATQLNAAISPQKKKLEDAIRVAEGEAGTSWIDKFQDWPIGPGLGPKQATELMTAADNNLASTVQGSMKELGDNAALVRWDPTKKTFEAAIQPSSRRLKKTSQGGAGTESVLPTSNRPVDGMQQMLAPEQAEVPLASAVQGPVATGNATQADVKMVRVKVKGTGQDIMVPSHEWHQKVARLQGQGYTLEQARAQAVEDFTRRLATPMPTDEHSLQRSRSPQPDTGQWDANLGWTGY